MAAINKTAIKRIAESYSMFALEFDIPLEAIEKAIEKEAWGPVTALTAFTASHLRAQAVQLAFRSFVAYVP